METVGSILRPPLMALRRSLASIALAALSACSAAHHRADADREVYAILAQRRAQLLGKDGGFTVDRPPSPLRDRLLGEASESRPAEALTFNRALEVAAENSREFQRQKELVYLAALDLTLERYRLGYIPAAFASAALAGTGDEATDAAAAVGGSLSKILGSGAQIVATAGLGLFRSLLTSEGWRTAPTTLGLAITQPLLRGAGPSIVEEPLTQAERDVVYAIRAYERFRQELAFDVANRFYRLLQQHDVIRNERANYDNLQVVRARNEGLAQAGRLSEIEVGQAQQNELSARNRWIVAVQDYESSVDAFRVFLGLPTAAPVGVDLGELERLNAAGLVDVDLAETAAFRIARELRHDFRTANDRVDDAERRVRVAEDALRAGLDLSANYVVSSEENVPTALSFDDSAWLLGLDLDLPVDRLPERNAYRAVLIARDAERRAAGLFGDTVRLQIRAVLRDLAQARESYGIQRAAVELAERRVASTELYQQAGRSSTRDVLEAQEALLQARNALTGALIDSTLARLALYRDLGALQLDENGLAIDPVAIAALEVGPP